MFCLLKVGRKIISRVWWSMRNLLRFVKSCEKSETHAKMENEEQTIRKRFIKLFNFTIFIQGQVTPFLYKQVE